MDPLEHPGAKRVEELFAAALALEPEARAAFLAASAGDDATLRAEVLSLLAHHVPSSGFLAAPLIERELAAPAALPAPERIGPFRILRELGHGGMGVVYLAEQEHPRRQVALKVIRPGIATPQALRRFEHEAQVLARLQHPGIAQIFEAGTADYGLGPQPYFALEYVQGPSLRDHVESQRLGTRERLQLLAQVCDALDHAHRRGVIHRDLKPTNVLVDTSTGAAQVKVLDFGIARVTDADAQTTSLRTDIGQVIGTLPYMSPEQASGDPTAVDHKSDVYALGVIGYELLCGRLPLDVVGKPLHEAVRIVRDDEPTPLSKLLPLLRGDVETIFAKALEKSRERRYASAAELAADIRRYLADRPIVARPASRVYVLSKFARRNKALVGGVAAVVLALSAGLIATLRQSFVTAAESARADQEARRARAVARFQREMLARVKPELDGRDVRLADVLDAAAASLPGEFAGDPAAEGSVRETLGESYHALGMLEPAERELRAAWSLLRDALGAEHDETVQALAWLATVVADLGRDDEAVSLNEQAYRGLLALHGRKDEQTLVAELNLAQAYFQAGRADEAERLARENLELRREVFGEGDVRWLNALSIAGQFAWAQGRFDEAEPLMREALERGRAIEGDEHPNTLTRCFELAAVLQQMGELDEAAALYERAFDVGERVLGDQHFEVLAWKHNFAALLERKGDLDRAEALYREVLESQLRTLGEDHDDTQIVRRNLAFLLAKRERWADAEALFLRVAESRRRTLGAGDPATLAAVSDVGWVLSRAGDFARALTYVQECAERGPESLPDDGDTVAQYLENLGTCFLKLARYSEAETALLAALERAPEGAAPRRQATTARLRELYLAWGKPELAATYDLPRNE